MLPCLYLQLKINLIPTFDIKKCRFLYEILEQLGDLGYSGYPHQGVEEIPP